MDYIKIGNLKFSRGVLFILPGILFFGIMVIYPAGYDLDWNRNLSA